MRDLDALARRVDKLAAQLERHSRPWDDVMLLRAFLADDDGLVERPVARHGEPRRFLSVTEPRDFLDDWAEGKGIPS